MSGPGGQLPNRPPQPYGSAPGPGYAAGPGYPAGPGYGYSPTPGWQATPGPPAYLGAPPYPAPRSPGTNGFAIASLILSLMCVPLLGLIFGLIALPQIKRRGQGGQGMAIAGIVISCVVIVVIVAAALLGFGFGASHRPAGPRPHDPPRVRMSNTLNLSVGECIEDIPEGSLVTSVTKVGCSQPHRGEVYEVLPLTASVFPGEAQLDDETDKCGPALARFAPRVITDSDYSIYYLQPTAKTWAAGDRTITCIAITADPRTGSLR